MKLKPLADHIVVKPLEAADKTAGGIILPDAAKEKATRGEVIAIGPGKLLENGKRLPPAVKVGDRVIYGKYGGNEMKLDGEQLMIIQESEILAVIN